MKHLKSALALHIRSLLGLCVRAGPQTFVRKVTGADRQPTLGNGDRQHTGQSLCCAERGLGKTLLPSISFGV